MILIKLVCYICNYTGEPFSLDLKTTASFPDPGLFPFTSFCRSLKGKRAPLSLEWVFRAIIHSGPQQ